MARTIAGLFHSMAEAEHVANHLQQMGFDRADISVVAQESAQTYWSDSTGHEYAGAAGETTATSAGTGAAIGGGIGLLAGLVALAIPGLGPIIAAGPLASVLAGTGIGAAAGGLIGGLTAVGIPEHEAERYSEGLRQGHILMTVHAPENRIDMANRIMQEHGALDVERQGSDND
jgi:hypothetical protein